MGLKLLPGILDKQSFDSRNNFETRNSRNFVSQSFVSHTLNQKSKSISSQRFSGSLYKGPRTLEIKDSPKKDNQRHLIDELVEALSNSERLKQQKIQK